MMLLKCALNDDKLQCMTSTPSHGSSGDIVARALEKLGQRKQIITASSSSAADYRGESITVLDINANMLEQGRAKLAGLSFPRCAPGTYSHSDATDNRLMSIIHLTK